jgi:DNA-directed RNA polymerase specialized sigma24 family protein
MTESDGTTGFAGGYHGAASDPDDGAAGRRHAADMELVALLARHGYSGPLYEDFERRLYGYGRAVLLAWLRTGEIFVRCHSRSFRLGKPPQPFTDDDRAHLADHTLAAALPAFRQRALIEGEWNPAGGAALTTYFVSGLPVHFPNVYRSWCRQTRREADWQSRIEPEPDFADIPDTTFTNDPLNLYLLRETVREQLRGLDATTRSVLILRYEGLTYAEIGEVHGMTARAVEAITYRHRQRMQRRPGTELE